jgi:hypothetical protein
MQRGMNRHGTAQLLHDRRIRCGNQTSSLRSPVPWTSKPLLVTTGYTSLTFPASRFVSGGIKPAWAVHVLIGIPMRVISPEDPRRGVPYAFTHVRPGLRGQRRCESPCDPLTTPIGGDIRPSMPRLAVGREQTTCRWAGRESVHLCRRAGMLQMVDVRLRHQARSRKIGTVALEPSTTRPVHVVPIDGGEVHLPADVAELIGADAELEVGPGQVVTLRPLKSRSSALVAAAGVKPLDDPRRLRHGTSSLTEDERAALASFLTG